MLGAGLSGFNAATGDVDGIFGGSAQTQVRDLQWKALTPAWMIISGWSKQTNNMKQPWIFGEPYTTINRKYLKLKMRLTPYLYTYAREAYDTGVPTVRAMVLEFPDDPVTWSKRTQYQFMSGASLLVAPVYEDRRSATTSTCPLANGSTTGTAREFNGPTTMNDYAAPLDKLPMFVRPVPSSRCTRRCSTTARSRPSRSRSTSIRRASRPSVSTKTTARRRRTGRDESRGR